MLWFNSPLLLVAAAFSVAFLSALWLHPKTVRVARLKNITDNPDKRKLQREPVPVLGGVVVFFGIVLGAGVVCSSLPSEGIMLIFTLLLLMLYTGTMDDIFGLTPGIRFLIEIFASLAAIYIGGYSVDGFHGLWGIGGISPWLGVPLTVVTVVGIINAVNLIDGVNGLSSGYCIMACVVFGAVFWTTGDTIMAVLAAAAMGALIPFFIHNVFGRRLRMFIGDGGTLMMGMLLSLFVLRVLDGDNAMMRGLSAGVAARGREFGYIPFTLAVLSIPVFDTLRVMTMRMVRGTSPFNPDKTHLHHAFIGLGFSHLSTTLTILGLNLATIAGWYGLYASGVGTGTQFVFVVAVSLLFTWGVAFAADMINVRRDNPVPAPDSAVPARGRVFVSGCYDMLHSGHIAFFRAAAAYGDLYVGIGSDATVYELKHRHTICSEQERLYMVRSIRYVKEAYINRGSGYLDFVETVDAVRPDIFVVNEDGSTEEKRQFCESRGIKYIVLERTPEAGLVPRSTTAIRNGVKSMIPYRLDLAGTWIDQPYVSKYGGGWALTVSIEPTMEYKERCGMSTSTRNAIRKIWPYELPGYRPELLAKLVFCFENAPEKEGHISGAQDAIGICMPGLNRHYYDGHYWPEKIESCNDERILSWLEDHICLVEMFPRRAGVSVIAGSRISESGVKALSAAAERCWAAIMNRDLAGFAESYRASFEAQVSMFPSMIRDGVEEYISRYASREGVLALKMSGAGAGGYLALVCTDRIAFPSEAVAINIRR